MKIEYLGDTANHIGPFFAPDQDHPQSQCASAEQLEKFWAACMQRTRLARIKATSGTRLRGFLNGAVASEREMLEAIERLTSAASSSRMA